MGIVKGLTLVVGTLMPPILRSELGHLLITVSGQIGVFVALIGVGLVT